MGSVWLEKKIKLNEANLSFRAPKSWQMVNGLYGRDVSLIGPELGPKRDVITIEQAQNQSFSIDKEKKALPRYKKLKASWIKQKKGTVQRFDLGKTLPGLKKNHLFNEVSYRLDGNDFVEGDLFMKCSDKKFLNISFLTLKNKQEEFKKIWVEILRSIKC
jgi:hypothetical protein